MMFLATALTFTLLWKHDEPNWMLAIPTVVDGTVYEGTASGDVVALDARDGSERWRANLFANADEVYGSPRGVISSIAVSGGVAYAVSGSCTAGAFDAQSGRELWRKSICGVDRNDDTYASPVVAADRLLVGIDILADRPTDQGVEEALDLTTGAVTWQFSPVRYNGTGGGISTTPAVDADAGLAFVGTGNPTPMTAPPAGPDPYTDSVIAFASATGRWRWVSGPIVPHDVNDFDVFASPRLFAIQRHGERVPAVGVVLKNSLFVALDERNGTELWRRQIEPSSSWLQAVGTPAVAGDTIVVPLYHTTQSGELVALRASDGSVLWRKPAPGIYEAPVVWHNTVVAAEGNGKLAAFALSDGAAEGSTDLGTPLFGHGLALDGDVLYAPGRNHLWAYRLTSSP